MNGRTGPFLNAVFPWPAFFQFSHEFFSPVQIPSPRNVEIFTIL